VLEGPPIKLSNGLAHTKTEPISLPAAPTIPVSSIRVRCANGNSVELLRTTLKRAPDPHTCALGSTAGEEVLIAIHGQERVVIRAEDKPPRRIVRLNLRCCADPLALTKPVRTGTSHVDVVDRLVEKLW
jgi:hypothetical protein